MKKKITLLLTIIGLILATGGAYLLYLDHKIVKDIGDCNMWMTKESMTCMSDDECTTIDIIGCGQGQLTNKKTAQFLKEREQQCRQWWPQAGCAILDQEEPPRIPRCRAGACVFERE